MIARAVAALLLGSGLATATPLVSKASEKTAIPNWDLQSSSSVSKDLKSLAKPGVDTSSWHHAPVSKCTLMGCLLEEGVYKDTELWYSENLKKFNWGQFSVPWVYRNQFELTPAKGQHFLLETHGIGSKADLFFNGKQIADKLVQAGAYAGHTFDITDLVGKSNALVVQAYPTNYMLDFSLGYVDWNPYPPDNGTGIWRDINIKQTGAVAMGTLSVAVDIKAPVEKSPAAVTIRAKARNLENRSVEVAAEAVITDPSGGQPRTIKQTVTLKPLETRIVELKETIAQPKIWWPRQWGDQPLYKASLTFSVDKALSDSAKTNFGIRKVTSLVNKHNDTIFAVNGHDFQVVGGGYSADMFLRWDAERFTRIAEYMLDMNQNVIRLEGKMEHPELYDIADKIGLMVMSGWECCDKWESWEYNHDLSMDPPDIWDDHDYITANNSMIHEAEMMQTHPSMIAFLVGSDYWPDDRATKNYDAAMKSAYWQVPIISSASKRGYPELLGPSGMKMDGPYDWVPPNYWYDREPYDDKSGSAFGFGSELGSGVGTPEIGSLKKFLSQADMDDLWKSPNKGLYHMSTNVSSFYDRKIYNEGLWKRYGAPSSLEDYLMKAQIMDYEATRSQYEGFASFWTTGRPATGIIYWMLNNAWPSLHWNQFDHYLHPAGSYYGSKTGSRNEHVAYNYQSKDVWIINRYLSKTGNRKIDMELIGKDGKVISKKSTTTTTKPNTSFRVAPVEGINKITDVAFLRLILTDDSGAVLSRNVYWISKNIDTLDWPKSTWFYTPISKFADYTALNKLPAVTVDITTSAKKFDKALPGKQVTTLTLENKSTAPAFFIRLNLVDAKGGDVNPVAWTDNYLTLWPKEKLTVQVNDWDGSGKAVQVSGKNIKATTIKI